MASVLPLEKPLPVLPTASSSLSEVGLCSGRVLTGHQKGFRIPDLLQRPPEAAHHLRFWGSRGRCCLDGNFRVPLDKPGGPLGSTWSS